MKFRNDSFLLKCIVLLLLALFVLSGTGCANMTPEGKRTAWIVGGIIVGAVIISSERGSAKQPPTWQSVCQGNTATSLPLNCRPQ